MIFNTITATMLIRSVIRPIKSQILSQHQATSLITSYGDFRLYEQTRCAGHAKWQNIKSTKQANDLAKGRLYSRYVQLVRKAVISGGRQPNPKLNSKLAIVLTEAAKYNVPKATLERAIERAMNVQIRNVNIEIQGPGKCSLIVRCETDNVASLRRDIKKAVKKFEGILLPDGTINNMFRSQGFVRIESITKDGKEIDGDMAEEAAIIANAQEVNIETCELEGGKQSQLWVFSTDEESLEPCKGELEKLGYKVVSSDLELVAYRDVDFGEEVFEKLEAMITILREIDQVSDVYHNVLRPQEKIAQA